MYICMCIAIVVHKQHVYVCAEMYSIDIQNVHCIISCIIWSSLLNKYLEGHTKSLLCIRGTYHQYCLMLYM